MPSLDRAPSSPQIPLYPLHDLAAQPRDVLRWVVAAGVLAFGIRPPASVDDVNQGVGMPQVIQEFVTQPLALVRSRDQSSDVEQLNRYGTPPLDAGSVIGLAPVLDIKARAGAFYLEVADGSLRIYRGESEGLKKKVGLVWVLPTGYICTRNKKEAPTGSSLFRKLYQRGVFRVSK